MCDYLLSITTSVLTFAIKHRKPYVTISKQQLRIYFFSLKYIYRNLFLYIFRMAIKQIGKI